MSISFKKARDFVYSNGALWERALFAYLFEEGALERVHRCLACYRNPDGGWGHGMEHDIRTPESHPLALEYILQAAARDVGFPAGTLFDDAAKWVESQRNDDGSLKNPPSVLDYPHAPWWNQGGQTAPDSITGNLHKLGKSTPSLLESTKKWAQSNLTLDRIEANEWLFMAYHAYDYFMNIDDYPDLDAHRAATIRNIVDCAARAPEKQYYVLFTFAPTPESSVAKAAPPEIVARYLDYVESTQQDDGRWLDEHNLPQWQPFATLIALLALKHYGRWHP